MLRVTVVSGVCEIGGPPCEWLPQTVYSLSCVLFSLTIITLHSEQRTHFGLPTTLVPGLFWQRSPHGSILEVLVPGSCPCSQPDPHQLYPFLLLPVAAYLTNTLQSRIPQVGRSQAPQRRRLPTSPSSNRGLPILWFLFPGPFPPPEY